MKQHQYWGWVPQLTRTLYFETGPEERAELIGFDAATSETLEEVIIKNNFINDDRSYFKYEYISDSLREKFLCVKYRITINKIDRNDTHISINLAIGHPVYKIGSLIENPINNEDLIVGTAIIGATGLVSYDFENNSEYSSYYADQMHIVIRNLFHEHDHHSSDLPLNTVKASSEEEAITKIVMQYIQKFSEYKQVSIRARPNDSINDLHRAKGEIEYARSYLNMYKDKLGNDQYTGFQDSIESFSNSFDILLARVHDKITLGYNCAVGSLTLFVLAYTIVGAHPILSQFKLYFDLSAWELSISLAFLAAFYFLWKTIKCFI